MKTTIPNRVSCSWEQRFENLVLFNILFSQTELFNQFAVALQIVFAKVTEQTLTATYHLHQATVCRKILLVFLQMFGNAIDTLCKQSYLTLNGTGIIRFAAELGENI